MWLENWLTISTLQHENVRILIAWWADWQTYSEVRISHLEKGWEENFLQVLSLWALGMDKSHDDQTKVLVRLQGIFIWAPSTVLRLLSHAHMCYTGSRYLRGARAYIFKHQPAQQAVHRGRCHCGIKSQECSFPCFGSAARNPVLPGQQVRSLSMNGEILLQ